MSIPLILLWITCLLAGLGIGRASFGVSQHQHEIILQGIYLIGLAIVIQLISVSLNLYTLEVLNHV